ncbi:DUF7793 family protein [Kaarinaea lacus]
MTKYRLDFCTIFHRDDDIAIIEIDEGVNLDASMADELVALTRSKLGDRPFALLSNRIHSYSLSFDAMSELSKLPNLVALAIVIYSQKSLLLVETQNFFLSTMKKRPVKIFKNMDEGIAWLKKEIDKLTVSNTSS